MALASEDAGGSQIVRLGCLTRKGFTQSLPDSHIIIKSVIQIITFPQQKSLATVVKHYKTEYSIKRSLNCHLVFHNN